MGGRAVVESGWGVERLLEDGAVIAVGAGDPGGEGRVTPIRHRVAFGAQLAPVRGIRIGVRHFSPAAGTGVAPPPSRSGRPRPARRAAGATELAPAACQRRR